MNHKSAESSLILVVDDETFIRMQLRMCLEREGYRVVEAENGRQALSIYSQTHPDIVLLDALMPDVDGFECCEQLQTIPEGRYTPVLMITGLEDQVSVDHAFEVGAADYVTKPIHWAVLRQRVRRLIQQAQLQKELEIANRELQRLVAIDGLTQVANRRRFDEYLEQEWRRMAREQQPLSLLVCDLDYFKPYNDTYGHQAGDRCLQQVAQAIGNTVRRPADLVARYGGEEFAVILPNTDAVGAVQVAEAVCGAVRALRIPHRTSRSDCHVTLSVGIASMTPVPHSSPSHLLANADVALYQAKASGRDRFVLHVSDPKTPEASSPIFPAIS